LEHRAGELPPYEQAAVLLLARHGYWLHHERFLATSGLAKFAVDGVPINWAASCEELATGMYNDAGDNRRAILDQALIWATNRLRLGQIPKQHLGIIVQLQYLAMRP
jgi:hypothetical protein